MAARPENQMSTTSSVRPFTLIVLAIALVLAGAVGALLAVGATPHDSISGAPVGDGTADTAAGAPDTAGVTQPDGVTQPASGNGTGGPVAVPATIDAAVAVALGDSSATLTAGAARGAGLLRLLIGRTDRAEITVSTANGDRTLLYVRGTIAAISPSSVTVTLRDGSTQAFSIDASTRIRSKGRQVATTALSPGDRVLALGLKSGATYSAIVVRSPGVPPVKAAAGGGTVPAPVASPATGG
jgi:Domain of unknown function (DUF5666)